MKNLSPTGSTTTHGLFVIIKHEDGFRLGLKPIRQGATLTFLDINGLVPIFKDHNPLHLINSAGTERVYEVSSQSSQGTYYFNMGPANSSPNQYPYSLRIEAEAANQASLRWVGNGLRVFDEIKVSGEAAINFVRGYSPEEYFSDVVFINQDGVEYQLPESQSSGLWLSPAVTAKTTFHFAVSGKDSKEVIGDEDADLEIVPIGGY